MTTGFGYVTYPAFQIEWSDHALPAILKRIEATDPSIASSGDVVRGYRLRNQLVLWALVLAMHEGYTIGIRTDSGEPDWPAVFVELPTGQVSWHLTQHEKEWDGHSTADKYGRIERFCEQQLAGLPKPDPAAMRYGQATYPETHEDRLSFRGEIP